MKPETAALGIQFFSQAFAEAENEIEAQKIQDCAYELNIQIVDPALTKAGLFEAIADWTKPE